MSIESKVIEVQIEHPAEQIFDIAPGTTMIEQVQVEQEMIQPVEYDNKDMEVEEQLQTVFSAAMSAFETQQFNSEGADPKFQARAMEVANAFLNTALAAAMGKSQLKQHKDRLKKPVIAASVSNTTNNNTLIMDRNELVKLIQNGGEEGVIDV
jgi:hypothetical protein